jgi:outer membrane protein assembly factor BamB
MRGKRGFSPWWAAGLLAAAALTVLAQPQPGTVLWTYDFYPVGGWGPQTPPSPALGSDGTVYLGTALGLQALTNAGTAALEKWTFSVPTTSGIAVGIDGTVYLANASQSFYAVNPDGSQKWAYTFDAAGSSQPAIGWDNTIYVVADASLYALTADGTKRWSRSIGSNGGIPAIDSAGTIYVRLSQWGTNFFAFNPNGTLKWTARLTGACNFGIPVAIGADETIYVGGSSGLCALTPNGSQLWFNQTNDFVGTMVGSDGTIYSGGWANSTLYALTPSGEYKWHVPLGDRVASKWIWPPTVPAIDAAGTVYYTAPNSLFAISPDGQVQWVVTHPNPQGSPVLESTSPAVAPNGTIYVTISNTLFAIAGTYPPGNTPWPMYQQNARRTGKTEKPALSQPRKRADANFEFRLHAQLGRTNTLETSTNLTAWDAWTKVIVTNVPMDVVDFAASNSPARFYRATSPP